MSASFESWSILPNFLQTLRKYLSKEAKKKKLSERRYRQFSKCSGTDCAAFESWPMKCKTAVKHLLNTRRNGQKERRICPKGVTDNFPNAVVRTVRLLNRGL